MYTANHITRSKITKYCIHGVLRNVAINGIGVAVACRAAIVFGLTLWVLWEQV